MLAVALAFGCGGDDDADTDTGTDAGVDTTMEDTGGDTTAGPASHQANTYRVINVDITHPNGIGAILSALIQGDLDANRLHILIDLQDFGAASGDTTFTITGNAGETTANEGEYAWHSDLDPSTFFYAQGDITADGDFINTETTRLDFPALVPDSDPPEFLILPLEELFIDGFFEEAGGQVLMSAALDGVILESDAETIEVSLSAGAEPQLLSEILSNVSDPDYPEEGENATGWAISADIQAIPIVLVE